MGDKISQLIRVLDQLPEEQCRELLIRLFREDPFTAIRIIRRHFDFADLKYADSAGLGLLFEKIGERRMLAALQGAEDVLMRRFSAVLGTRKAITFIADLDACTATDLETTASRRAVLVAAMMLHRSGRLKITRPDIDDKSRTRQ